MKFIKLVVGLLIIAASASAQAQDAVSLRLNWYLGGLHVPFYYGKDMGFYKQEGIDLTINEGRGSANTVQVVESINERIAELAPLVPDGYEIRVVANPAKVTRLPTRPAAQVHLCLPGFAYRGYLSDFFHQSITAPSSFYAQIVHSRYPFR